MKPLTSERRKKIKMYIKNGLDIADLIDGYSIKHEDLKGAIITHLNRANDDMCGVDFTKATIGTRNKINNISGSKLKNSKWCDCIVLGTMFARKCDFRNTDFSGAVLTNLEYQNSDFRGAKFCEVCMRLGSSYGWGARFDETFFADLAKGWNVNVTLKDGDNV